MRFRRQQILQQLLERGAVQVTDLTLQFGVSAVTIRADLNHLRAQGLVTRTHGGALLLRPPPTEQDIHEKDTLNLPLKERIGKRAAHLVKPGDNIIIDSGTTTATLARHLRLRKQSLSLQGSQAEASLSGYSFDTLFLGVDGLDLQFGLTTHDEAEARLNHRMVERARHVVVLTDASKFGRISLHRIARLEQIQTVITDSGIHPDTHAGLCRMGIEVMIAEP